MRVDAQSYLNMDPPVVRLLYHIYLILVDLNSNIAQFDIHFPA